MLLEIDEGKRLLILSPGSAVAEEDWERRILSNWEPAGAARTASLHEDRVVYPALVIPVRKVGAK